MLWLLLGQMDYTPTLITQYISFLLLLLFVEQLKMSNILFG